MCSPDFPAPPAPPGISDAPKPASIKGRKRKQPGSTGMSGLRIPRGNGAGPRSGSGYGNPLLELLIPGVSGGPTGGLGIGSSNSQGLA